MFKDTQPTPSKKGDTMEPQEDVIVDIAKNRERYFGCSGKMLIPSPATRERGSDPSSRTERFALNWGW